MNLYQVVDENENPASHSIGRQDLCLFKYGIDAANYKSIVESKLGRVFRIITWIGEPTCESVQKQANSNHVFRMAL